MDKKSAIIENRKQKIIDLKNNHINLFPNDFIVLHTIRDIIEAIETSPDRLTPDNPDFVVAGRMM
ncbi:MAG: lysine--tRNA ligase, partial [Desulfobacterales bacterium]